MRGSWRGLGLLLTGLLGCSSSSTEPLPDAPQIQIFPDSQAFGSDVGFGTYVGTSFQQSFQITNEGKETLVISSVIGGGSAALKDGGPNVFAFVGPSVADPTADGGIVESRQQTFIRVTFTPTQPIKYTGTLTIKSNAAGGESISLDGGAIKAADPTSIDVQLSGFGVLPPPDAGPDGG